MASFSIISVLSAARLRCLEDSAQMVPLVAVNMVPLIALNMVPGVALNMVPGLDALQER